MKGLILKDFLVINSHKFYFLIIGMFIVIPDMFLGNFAIIFAAMLPVTTIAYDERSKWNELAIMMPYSNRDLVLSKYFLGYILVLSVTIMSFLAHFMLSIFISNYLELLDFSLVISVACIALILNAVNTPFMLKYGIEKGRFVMIAIVVLISMLGTNFNLISEINFVGNNIYYLIFVAAIVINIISICISLNINSKTYKN